MSRPRIGLLMHRQQQPQSPNIIPRWELLALYANTHQIRYIFFFSISLFRWSWTRVRSVFLRQFELYHERFSLHSNQPKTICINVETLCSSVYHPLTHFVVPTMLNRLAWNRATKKTCIVCKNKRWRFSAHHVTKLSNQIQFVIAMSSARLHNWVNGDKRKLVIRFKIHQTSERYSIFASDLVIWIRILCTHNQCSLWMAAKITILRPF